MTDDTYIPTAADRQIQAMILRKMPAESTAFHALQEQGHLDVPRDAFQRLFWEDGHDEALRICTHPERPYPGISVWDQPLDRMVAWEQHIARHRKARSSP